MVFDLWDILFVALMLAIISGFIALGWRGYKDRKKTPPQERNNPNRISGDW